MTLPPMLPPMTEVTLPDEREAFYAFANKAGLTFAQAEKMREYARQAVQEAVAAQRERDAQIAEGFDACDTKHIAAAIRGATSPEGK